MANFRDVPRGSLLKRRKRDADDIKPQGAAEGHVQVSAPIGSVGVGSAADARERQSKAAESRREKAAARGISDMERVKEFAEGSSEVFAYGARRRLRAELDRAAAKSAAEKRRGEKR